VRTPRPDFAGPDAVLWWRPPDPDPFGRLKESYGITLPPQARIVGTRAASA
jgi:hypothetical protein